MWCLQCPDDTDEAKDGIIVDEKVHRWKKSTLEQNINVLKEWKHVNPENNKTDDLIKELENKKDNIKVKEMPKYQQLLDKLPDDFRRKISLKLYKDFNKAVHLDINSLGELSLYNKRINDKNKDISRLKDFCFLLAKSITGVIAINYDEKNS